MDPAAWERERHNDFGSPEALAYKVIIWEAWANAHGFRVETPASPGLHYVSWAELQAEGSRSALAPLLLSPGWTCGLSAGSWLLRGEAHGGDTQG